MAERISPETSSDDVDNFSNLELGSSSPEWRDTMSVSQCVGHLCLSPHLSDVTLKFSKEPSVKLPAHKFVLGMRSRVFEAMLYGKQGVTDNTVTIDDIGSKTMQELIRFIHTDEAEINEDNVVQCMHAAKLYSVAGLATKCSAFLEGSINAGNVCTIHEQAIHYSMKDIHTKCLNYLLENANDVFKSDGFLKISQATLVRILQSDALDADEETIFTAASAWAESQCISNSMTVSSDNKRTVLGKALSKIRFPLMTKQSFAKLDPLTNILTNDEKSKLDQYFASEGTARFSKFDARKRSGNIVTIDLSKFMHPKKDNSHEGYSLVIAFTNNESNSIMLKATSGMFADDVKTVCKASSSNIPIQFKKEAGKLIFEPPIPINHREEIVFDTNANQNVSIGFKPKREFSYEAEFPAEVHDTEIRITLVPNDLTNITFVRPKKK